MISLCMMALQDVLGAIHDIQHTARAQAGVSPHRRPNMFDVSSFFSQFRRHSGASLEHGNNRNSNEMSSTTRNGATPHSAHAYAFM